MTAPVDQDPLFEEICTLFRQKGGKGVVKGCALAIGAQRPALLEALLGATTLDPSGKSEAGAGSPASQHVGSDYRSYVCATLMRALGRLDGVERLELWGKVPDLEMLLGLERLEAVELSLDRARDLAALKTLPALRRLGLGMTSCDMKSLRKLPLLPGLRRLELRGWNRLVDFSRLKGLPKLEELKICGSSDLVELGAIGDYANLKTLELADCMSLRSLQGLETLGRLEKLVVQGCPALDKLDIVERLTSLRELKIDDWPRSADPALVEGLTHLTLLDLDSYSRRRSSEPRFSSVEDPTPFQRLRDRGCRVAGLDGLVGRRDFSYHQLSLKAEQAKVKAAGLPEADESLQLAAIRGAVRPAEKALEAGANTDRRGPLGYRALDRAMRRKRSKVVALLVGHAIERAELSEPDRGLLQAALRGDVASAVAALDAGATINARDAYGSTALTTACRLGHGELVGRLLQDEGIDLNAEDSGWGNPLALATLQLRVDLLKTLLRAGADPKRRCVEETASFIACKEARTSDAEETLRFLGQARSGKLPPDPEERYPSHELCRLCRELPASVRRDDSRRGSGGEEAGESTPRASYWLHFASSHFKELARTHREHRTDSVLICLLCDTGYSVASCNWDEPYDPFPIDTEEMKRMTETETAEWLKKIAKQQGTKILAAIKGRGSK